MEKYDVKFKKKFGQNFLKDINVVKKIVRSAEIDGKSLVIEVGPGGGIMTRELSMVADNVLAYEIDEELKEEHAKRLGDRDNITILFQDFLESDIVKDVEKYDYDKLYFVSNVPYYITTPIIMPIPIYITASILSPFSISKSCLNKANGKVEAIHPLV